MKSKVRATLVLLLGLLCVASAHGGERLSDTTTTSSTNKTTPFRTWTSGSGKTTRAEYLTTWDGYIQTEEKKGERITIRTKPTEGKVWVVLRNEEGRQFHVERSKLSSFDRQHLDLRNAGLYTPGLIHMYDYRTSKGNSVDAFSFLMQSQKAKQGGTYDFLDFVIREANKGNRYAQSLVGRSYMHRAEKTSDRKRKETYRNKGIASLKDAAAKGDKLCQKTLGQIYTIGSHGVQRDAREARRWYALAAKDEDPEALAMLGFADMEFSPTLAADFFFRAGKGYLKEKDREHALMCVDRLNDVDAKDFASQLKEMIYQKTDKSANK